MVGSIIVPSGTSECPAEEQVRLAEPELVMVGAGAARAMATASSSSTVKKRETQLTGELKLAPSGIGPLIGRPTPRLHNRSSTPTTS